MSEQQYGSQAQSRRDSILSPQTERNHRLETAQSLLRLTAIRPSEARTPIIERGVDVERLFSEIPEVLEEQRSQ